MSVEFYSWPKPPQKIVVEDDGGGRWTGLELHGTNAKPHKQRGCAEFTVLQELVSEEEVREILQFASEALAKSIEAGGSREMDSVDFYPSFETYFMTQGNYEGGLQHVLQPIIETRLAPYIRKRFQAPDATACTCLFRRYVPEERRIHPVHFDYQAFSTAVVGLNPGDFEGGLFVSNALDRKYVPLGRGDVCVHQYDLLHGVDVRKGSRYSLIIWFMDSPSACLHNTRLWYRRAAEEGDADAQYNWAQCHFEGEGSGQPRNIPEALKWYKKACDQDNVHALTMMGRHFWVGEEHPDLEANPARAVEYWSRAASLGYTNAMTTLGGMLLTGGDGLIDPDVERGLCLLQKAADLDDVEGYFKLGFHGYTSRRADLVPYLREAAERGHPYACFMMGQIYQSGDFGWAADQDLALRFTKWAVHLGVPEAMTNLGAMCLEGHGIAVDTDRAVHLFQQANEVGDAKGTLMLAICHARGIVSGAPDAQEALKLCREAADTGLFIAQALLEEFESLASGKGSSSELLKVATGAAPSAQVSDGWDGSWSASTIPKGASSSSSSNPNGASSSTSPNGVSSSTTPNRAAASSTTKVPDEWEAVD